MLSFVSEFIEHQNKKTHVEEEWQEKNKEMKATNVKTYHPFSNQIGPADQNKAKESLTFLKNYNQ